MKMQQLPALPALPTPFNVRAAPIINGCVFALENGDICSLTGTFRRDAEGRPCYIQPAPSHISANGEGQLDVYIAGEWRAVVTVTLPRFRSACDGLGTVKAARTVSDSVFADAANKGFKSRAAFLAFCRPE